MNSEHFLHMPIDLHFSLFYIFKGTKGNFNLKLTVSIGFCLPLCALARESSVMCGNICELLDIIWGNYEGNPV